MSFFTKLQNIFSKTQQSITGAEPVDGDTTGTVVTRIPPSPTGNLHVGTARTALFNYLFAKQHNGSIVLRMEDTDKERSKPEFEKNIIEGLQWLGITWDNKTIYRQSERGDVYKKYLGHMITDGTAYVSKEEAEEGKRGEVIRFKNPNKVVTFTDEVRGEISFDTTELGDFVIAKSLDEPLYHLAVVVDDFDMGITHVIRGEDGISNTPRQILIQEAIGAPRPVYAHLPLLLGEDKSKLSKRNGAKSISEFQEEGYVRDALLNYLAFLGWNPGTDQEIFSMDELITSFNIKQVQKGGAVFSKTKLDWYNQAYLRKLTPEAQERIVIEQLKAKRLAPELVSALTPIIFDRITTSGEIKELLDSGELDYFFEAPTYEAASLLWKKSEDLLEMKEHLLFAKNTLLPLEIFTRESVKDALWEYAGEQGRGNVLWPLRYALSGKERSPDPFEIAEILGKTETLARIDTAIDRINENQK